MLLLLSCFSVTPRNSPGRIPEGQDLTGSTISIFSLLADLFLPGHCMGQGLTLVQSPVAGEWGLCLLCTVMGHSLLGDPATILWGHSSSPVKRSTYWGAEPPADSQHQLFTTLQSSLRSAHTPLTSWWQLPKRPWAILVQRSCSLNFLLTETVRGNKINCCFRPLSLVGICC